MPARWLVRDGHHVSHPDALVGLFTASTMNQALVVLGSYAFVLAGSWEGSGEGMTVHHDGRTLV